MAAAGRIRPAVLRFPRQWRSRHNPLGLARNVLTEGEPVWYRWADVPKEQLSERLSRRLITGDRVMLAHVYLKRGCVVPRHAHENEQFTYILEGALRFLIGEDGSQEVVVRAGEVLHLASNVPHEAHALEDTLDMDVFSPPREDWLKGTDAYLRGT